MPFSHYYGLWKNIPHCLTQIQMALTGRIRRKRDFFEWEFTKKMNAVGL